MTTRRGASDPVCGMQVDRAKAIRLELGNQTLYFCSEHCRRSFEAGATRQPSAAEREEARMGGGHPD